MDKRKPIDYIHEPTRQEILDLLKSLDKTRAGMSVRKNEISSEPALKEIYALFELHHGYLIQLLVQVTDLYAKYFQDVDAKKNNAKN